MTDAPNLYRTFDSLKAAMDWANQLYGYKVTIKEGTNGVILVEAVRRQP